MTNQKVFFRVEKEKDIIGGWAICLAGTIIGEDVIKESIYIKIWKWRIKILERCYVVPICGKVERIINNQKNEEKT